MSSPARSGSVRGDAWDRFAFFAIGENASQKRAVTAWGAALVALHKSVVPEGRAAIAQQFTAGRRVKTRNVVPGGRLNTVPTRLNRPSRTNDYADSRGPSDKSLGYCRMSLLDGKMWVRTRAFRPRPNTTAAPVVATPWRAPRCPRWQSGAEYCVPCPPNGFTDGDR